jgi:hypothetical protein
MTTATPTTSLASHLLTDGWLRLCALFALFILCLPPEPAALPEICWFKRLTGTPCPGCGMSRAGANLVHGRLARSLEYHPLGVLIIPAVLALGALALAPRHWRQAARAAIARHDRGFRCLFWSLTIGFVLFGLIRWLAVITGSATFPANWH